MSDDLTSKIQQLKDMLNNNQMPDNLKNIMELMSSNSSNKDENPKAEFSVGENSFGDTEVMIKKFKKIMDKKRDMNDPRINLLNAIKPYLGQKRQGRIDNCTKMLNFIHLSTVLKDDD